jgi:hypothetical protein
MFSVEGSYQGGEALLSWDGTQVTGWPSDAVSDAEEGLVRARVEGQVPATPTGPFYPPDSNEGVLLVLLAVLDAGPVDVLGEAPVIEAQPDELGLSPADA